MTHAVTGDLHWEVKYNALDFWFDVFEVHLNNQGKFITWKKQLETDIMWAFIHSGMIDRVFPSVTFSKEQRKIVTLNETEIRRRLIKALNQLSHTGCLYVLKTACLDDCDLEVSKKAATAVSKLMKLLKMYQVSKSMFWWFCSDKYVWQVPCDQVDMSEPPSPCVQTNRINAPSSNSPGCPEMNAASSEFASAFTPQVRFSVVTE